MKTPQRDGNEAGIVKDLRARGYLVQTLHQGGGVPDLIVSNGPRMVLVEVKDPAQPPSGRRLTPAQVRWHAEWRDAGGADVYVCETVEQVMAALCSRRVDNNSSSFGSDP